MSRATPAPRSNPRIPAARDPHRPRFHFLAPRNWLNDPNGLIQWQGQYHLFYQHNPKAAVWGQIYWGHAVSPDLVHWSDLPLALAPSPDGPDCDGCWSGVTVNHSGVPTLIYTGVGQGQQRPCVATSTDGLLTWQKSTCNPVIAGPPAGFAAAGFRDHSVWQQDGAWYMLIGSGEQHGRGTLFLYRSQNLLDWEYLHPFTNGAEHQRFALFTGEMWECPSFLALGDRHILLISACNTGQEDFTAAFTGDYRDLHFTPTALEKLDYGNRYFYAPQTFADSTGRTLMIGWVKEGRSIPAQVRAGWAGVMSLPKSLYLDTAGRLCQAFVPELQHLRQDGASWQELSLTDGQPVELLSDTGRQFELEGIFTPGSARRTLLALLRSPDGAEETRLVLDWSEQTLTLDRSRSSRHRNVEKTPYSAPLPADAAKPYRLHVFVDASIIEVLVNGRAAITSRVYPTASAGCAVTLLAEGGQTGVQNLQIWKIAPVWD